MSDFPEETIALFDRLAKAGGIVGMSNNEWWRTLVEDHGEAMVMGFITARRAETRQPVSVAVVANLCKKEAQRIQDEKDDAAEDAAMGRQIARSPKADQVAKGAAAAVVREQVSAAAEADTQPIREAAPAAVTNDSSPDLVVVVSTASPTAAGEAIPAGHREAIDQRKAAAIEKPWGLTKPTTQEKDMATIKQLVKSVEDEIKRRGISASAALREIGVHVSGLVTWRKGNCGAGAQEKINTWLPESAKKPAAGDTSPALIHRTIENVRVITKPARKPRQEKAETLFDSFEKQEQAGDLLARGEDLAERLTAFGCEGYAATVTELVAKVRAVRTALSALSA